MIVISPSSVRAQQAPINCKGPLSEEQLIGLLKGGVADVRVQAIVDKCGIDFDNTPEVEKVLVGFGASKGVIAMMRKKDKERMLREEEELWAGAKAGRSAAKLQEYLRRFPDGQYGSEAKDKLSKLRRVEELRTNIRQAKKEGNWQEPESWLKELSGLLPEDEEIRSWKSWIAEERSRALEARKREDEALWTSAKDGRSTERLEEYLKQFPDGDHASEARDSMTKMRRVEELRGKIRKAKGDGQWQDGETLLKELMDLSPEDEEIRSWNNWVAIEHTRWDSMTLAEAKQEVGSLEEKITQIRKTMEASRGVELKQLESIYRSEREKAGQVASKGEYEQSAEYEARLEDVKQKQAVLDAKWQADKDQAQRRYTTELEEKTSAYKDRIGRLKSRTYTMMGPSVQRIGYDADASRLSVKINGEEYWFKIKPQTAREFDARLGSTKVEQYLDIDRAQERVLVDVATGARFGGILRAVEEERLRREKAQREESIRQRRQELARITWIGPETGLMWALKDNGSDVDWKGALTYCQQLRLGGFSDWRLPDIAELEGIYDAPYKAKGSIRLSGPWAWSSTRNERGSAYDLLFDSGRKSAPYVLGYSSGGRALCVRHSGEEKTWLDPKTNLMWMLHDNGGNVSWNEAMSYCQHLRLEGYSNWRLPGIDELKGIYEPSISQQYKIGGGIQLSNAWTWSATRKDEKAAWYFDFNLGNPSFGYRFENPTWRALCVRRSGE
jgi:hypothetical protein